MSIELDTRMTDTTTELTDAVSATWDSYIAEGRDHRPALFTFGCRLTGSPFDGEDLAQEALMRGFRSTATQPGGVRNLQSYLFRTMANLWIDHQRRNHPEPDNEAMAEVVAPEPVDVDDVRAASERVLALSPAQRAAVVLHDAFGFTHAEVAEMTDSSAGAVRMALSRAKDQLRDPQPAPSTVDRSVIDAFIEAFTAADVDRIRTLLAEDVVTRVFPCPGGVGADDAMADGWINGSIYHHPDYEPTQRPFPTELRHLEFAGQPVIVAIRGGAEGMLLEEVWRFSTTDGLITDIQDYCFCRDVITHIGEQLGEPVRLLGYRFDERLGHQEAFRHPQST
ncbi:MAG: RNA polymerase sigma factor [Acidimicrobiales bacterium]|jgi:RNA polymerase sigma-70 factor (ECF subfamily)|nr:RNA polymerase sigma factor [Acidimicrobiales bacterium]